MKNFIFICLCFLLAIFALPIAFTKSFKIANGEIPQEKDETAQNNYDYQKYKTIKLLHSKTGEVEELLLDTYIKGVVAAEMPASYNEEALKAQAVVARTYTIYTVIHNNNKHENADLCDNSSCCQAWISKEDRLAKWEESKRDEYLKKIENAVDSTNGKIITYNGEVIDAFFHSNSGGITETPVNVWGGTNYPYLQSVQTAGEDAYNQYSSEVTLSKEEFVNKIKEKHPDLTINFDDEHCIEIKEFTESNRVKTIKVGNVNMSGVEMRTLLSLKSTKFEVKIDKDNINFKVTGYGHGVGMSQTGADSMAKQGSNYEDIIHHFYTNVEIVNYHD